MSNSLNLTLGAPIQGYETRIETPAVETRLAAPPQLENPANPLNSAAAWAWVASGHQTSDAGEFVNPDTAMRVAAVFSCVKVLAESIGSLTLNIYKRGNNGRSIAYDHNLYDLLAKQPNEEMIAQSFWEAAVTSTCLFGNFYAELERDSRGNITAMYPLLASQTEVVRINGSIAYKTSSNVATGEQTQRIIAGQNCFHLMLNSLDGLKGLSIIQAARETLGRARALDRFSSRFFSSFATPQMLLINKSPLPMSPESRTLAREDFEKLNSGNSQHRIGIIDSDFDVKQLSISQNDMQFLETKAFSRSEICGLFRVPEHFIGSLDRITNSNLETMNRQFLTQSLRPWLSRIEATVEATLLPKQQGQPMFFVGWDTSDFTRGDSAAQTAALQAGINSGWLSANECRAELGLNPGGPELDAYRCPVNLMNAKLLIDQKAPISEPLPEPLTEGDGEGDEKVPNAAQRAALKQYKTAFLGLTLDATRRVLAGENATRVFGPLLESIQDTISASVDVQPDSTRLVEYLTKLEARATTWTEAETTATEELSRAVKAFTFAAHEDAAKAAVAEVLDGAQ